ncbi:MAG: nucleotidyltransferase family protein [Actinomycetota bacterium]
MKAIILAAGEGKRLHPLTNDVPKVMLPIAGKPLLEHQILLCKRHGVDEVFLNLYYLPEIIIDYFKDKDLGIKVSWTVLSKLVNAAEALLLFKDKLEGDFPVLYGDVASKLNLSSVIRFHKSKNALATLVLHVSNHPEDSDLVEVDENNRILRFHKKPHVDLDCGKMNLGNAGTVVFSPEVFDFVKTGLDPDDSISHSLLAPLSAQSDRVFGYVTEDYMEDIGTLERYKRVAEEF